MPRRKMIFIEFNELSPLLLSRFMAQGELPSFKLFHDASVVFTTDAGEDPPYLEPWIQWPTIHSGVPFARHKISRLGDGRRNLAEKLVGDVLSANGFTVGLFSPMNLNYKDVRGYSIPDPWDPEGCTWPLSLQPFWQVVSRAVQESSRDGSMSLKDLLTFGIFLLRHGLRPSTVRSVLAQLIAERRSSGVGWRRASMLDAIQYDVFRFLNKRYDVDLATFFSNSTAHYQHYYWRNMNPSEFEVPPTPDDHPSLANAILHGYQSMDRLLARFMADEPNALLVLCTGLSQQPWTNTQKVMFRPRSFQSLFRFAEVAVPDEAIKPVMAEEFFLELACEADATRVRNGLLGLYAGNEQVLEVKQSGRTLFAKCRLIEFAAYDLDVRRPSDGSTCLFSELFYRINTMRSGRHHRDGALWFRTGRYRQVEGRVSLTEIAPTILAYFGVETPEHMVGRPLMIEPVEIGTRPSA